MQSAALYVPASLYMYNYVVPASLCMYNNVVPASLCMYNYVVPASLCMYNNVVPASLCMYNNVVPASLLLLMCAVSYMYSRHLRRHIHPSSTVVCLNQHYYVLHSSRISHHQWHGCLI